MFKVLQTGSTTHPIYLSEQGYVWFSIPLCDLGQAMQPGLETLNLLVPLPLGLEKAILLGLNLLSLSRGFQAIVENPGKLHEIIPRGTNSLHKTVKSTMEPPSGLYDLHHVSRSQTVIKRRLASF